MKKLIEEIQEAALKEYPNSASDVEDNKGFEGFIKGATQFAPNFNLDDKSADWETIARMMFKHAIYGTDKEAIIYFMRQVGIKKLEELVQRKLK